MSASFYDLMRYAKTGIASPSMTQYDKLKARAMCGGNPPVPVGVHLGFKIDKSVSDSNNAVIYTHDAVTMTPAYMDTTNGVFNYGSWGDVWFIKDIYPVALNLDGTEAYKLNPNDYTKKLDGTNSDISFNLLDTEPSDWATQWKQYYTKNASNEYEINEQTTAPTFEQNTYYKLESTFDGNFMVAFPKVYFKRYEDANYNYIEISDKKLDADFIAEAHVNANGDEVEKIYLPMFKGTIENSKLRSLAGKTPGGYTTATEELSAAQACGIGWQFWDHSCRELINDLLTLISKSLDCQTKFGRGRETGYDLSDTVTYGKWQTGTLYKKGAFFGYSASTKEVKVFHIEGFWANRWDRVLGLLLDDNVWKVKMNPPYNFTGTDFITLSDEEVPNGNGYLSRIQTSRYASIPASISGG